MSWPRSCLSMCHWLMMVLAASVCCRPACADELGPPKKEHWSANGKFVLKVRWGKIDDLSLWEKTEDGLNERWRRGYVDRNWPPHRAYVTDDGKYVVLRDVYHNLGRGKVIVVLGGKYGGILGSYELGDFLPQDEIRAAKRTVSSIWWNSNAWFALINGDREFALVRKDAERWVESEEAGQRIRGITLLGALRVEEALPVAKKLLKDNTRTGTVWRGGRPGATTSYVQKAAALALVRLTGAEAIPIIEEELSKANWYMKEELMEALAHLDTKAGEIVETPHSKAALEMWKRLAEHASDDVRYPALCQVLRREGRAGRIPVCRTVPGSDTGDRRAGGLGRAAGPRRPASICRARGIPQPYSRPGDLRPRCR